jgi:hypothetical protein
MLLFTDLLNSDDGVWLLERCRESDMSSHLISEHIIIFTFIVLLNKAEFRKTRGS